MPRDEDEFDDYMQTHELMSQSARGRWNRQQRERNEAILADCASGRAAHVLRRAARRNIKALDNGDQLDRQAREFINTMYALLSESGHKPRRENSMTTPQSTAVHAPMVGSHDHTHVHDDGVISYAHSHDHPHQADNSHEQHLHDTEQVDSPVRPGLDQSGAYGAEMSGNLGPAARMRIRNQRLRDHEDNR